MSCSYKLGTFGVLLVIAMFSVDAHAQGIVLFGNQNLPRPPAGPERPITFAQAQAAGMWWVYSAVFVYTEEFDGPPNNIDDKWMKNFTSFASLSPVRLQFDCASHSNDELRFFVRGYDTSRTVVLETKTNLTASATWLPIRTNIGVFWFTNSTADANRRFFRAIYR